MAALAPAEIERLIAPSTFADVKARPRCSACPVLDFCRQVGVGDHRWAAEPTRKRCGPRDPPWLATVPLAY